MQKKIITYSSQCKCFQNIKHDNDDDEEQQQQQTTNYVGSSTTE